MVDFEKYYNNYQKTNNQTINSYNKKIEEIELPTELNSLFEKIKTLLLRNEFQNDVLPSFRHTQIEETLDGISHNLNFQDKEYEKIKEEFNNIKENINKEINIIYREISIIETLLITIIIILVILLLK
jgi:uncharacterized phage infection (PIP) family protein YhgE